MEKKKVLIYSDCYLYGGSERLMSFLIRNNYIQEKYILTFAYRKHKIYQEGIQKEYIDLNNTNFLKPISVLSNDTIFYQLDKIKIHKYLKMLLIVFLMLLVKFKIYFFYNLISHCILLIKIRPDIIHINNGGYPGARTCNTMVLAARICRIKNVVYQVNNMAQKQIGYFTQKYDQFVNNNVKYFIIASEQAKKKLIEERKFDKNKIIQVRNTVNEELPSVNRQEILSNLSINQDHFILCSVGFLWKSKGQQFLLEALSIIKRENIDIFEKINLLLVGNGEDELYMKQLSIDLQIDKNVHFLGYQSKSINYINACDVLVFPSIANEDMPLVILTAMNNSKTIVASDFAGIREEIINGESGILITPNPSTMATDLANTIVNLFSQREHFYGQNAKKRFDELFSNHVYGQSIDQVYKMVCK